MNEEYIDNLITDLKIIGILQPNEKLNIRNCHLHIDRSSNFQFIKRWFYRDSRYVINVYIKDLIIKKILSVYDKIKEYSKSESVWILERILTELENANVGLNNLKLTYSNDPYMIATIENTLLKFKELCQKGRTMVI
jgi:hypothetical protein